MGNYAKLNLSPPPHHVGNSENFWVQNLHENHLRKLLRHANYMVFNGSNSLRK